MKSFEFDQVTKNWAIRTITLGLAIRSYRCGEPESERTTDKLQRTVLAAERVAAELWIETERVRPHDGDFFVEFADRVFDWIEENRRGQ